MDLNSKGFYDLLLKLDELKNLKNVVTSDLNIEQFKIKDIDQYLIQNFNNSFLIKNLKNKKTVSDKLNFINQLILNFDKNQQLFSNQVLLKKDVNHNYDDDKIRLTDKYLFTNDNEQELINELNKEIITSDEVNFIYPFISKMMINKIENSLIYANKHDIKIRIITTTFDNTAKYVNLLELERLVITYPNIEIRVEDNLEKRSERIHIKSSIFYRYSKFGTAIIGSSNLTFAGMMRGREWNIRISEFNDNYLYNKLCKEYFKIWKDYLVNFNNLECRKDFLARIEASQKEENDQHYILQEKKLLTNKKRYLYNFQKEIVDKLAYRRIKLKKTHHLIIMATGTGKTIVSAYDYKNQIKENDYIKPSVLFLAHQKEIIDQALMTFRSVIEDNTFGEAIYEGKKPIQNKYLFATIQTIYHKLADFNPKQFDIIIFDEAHHIAANSFEQVFNYFKPKQVIGLTATPERTDGKSIKKYFGDEYTYELRIWDAINQRLICPFDYYCIDDITDLTGVDLNNDDELFKKLNNDSRNQLLINMIEKYIGIYAHPMCVVFCITTDHAKIVSNFLKSKGLQSDYLTSEVNQHREQIIHNFKNGKINYLCVVNMFNEGIDIPEINTIIMLRPTNSQTVYLQQLGRGLRKTNLKNKLEVFDLIANVDQKYDISIGIKNLYHNKLIGINNKKSSFGYLPYGSTITLEKRSREVLIKNFKSWFNDKTNLRLYVKEYYQKYKLDGLSKILEHIPILEFYNMLDDFYLKVGQDIIHYKNNENNSNRNKNILKQFLFLNSYEIINYFYKRLNNLIDNKYDNYDNLLINSFFYEVTSLTRYKYVFPEIDPNDDIVDYFIKHNTLIVAELSLILKYKLENEVLIYHDNHLTNNLLSSRWTFTIKQVLCIIGRTNYLPKNKLKIIVFQAGYLTFNNSLVILADVDSSKYGKLTKYIEESKEYYWSLPEHMTINHKLVRNIQNINLTKFLFLQNKINHQYPNLKLKLYDFIGLGQYIEMIDSHVITALLKVI